MSDAGLRCIATSKEYGLWDYWADVDALIVPDDLRAAFDGTPQAGEMFDQSAQYYRRNLLRWVRFARTPLTRNEKIPQMLTIAVSRHRILRADLGFHHR